MSLNENSTWSTNYTTASGPGSSTWAGLSTAADTTAEYSTVADAAASTSTSLYTVYQFNVNYSAGSNVTAVETSTGNCKVSATGATTGGTSCTVTLPTFTQSIGYLPLGWNTTSGATTGTAAGASYTINVNPTTLYANAIDVWAADLSYDNSNSSGLNCTGANGTAQCALDAIANLLGLS